VPRPAVAAVPPFLALLLAAVAPACSGGNEPSTHAEPPKTTATRSGPSVTRPPSSAGGTNIAESPIEVAPRATWTVLVYLDADNNIEADLLHDLERMATVGSSDALNVIVLADRSPADNSYSAGPGQFLPDADILGLPNFDTAKLLRIGNGNAEEIDDLGEVSMSDPQTLAWFTYTGITRFPADHYALVLDDHGGALLSMQDDSDTPRSDGSLPALTLTDVGDALDAALSQAGVDHLDFFGYDTCLMADYDAVVQLAPYADWFVGSEELTIGPQWDFAPMLRAVADDPSATGADMGQAIVENVLDAVPYYPNATMSLIDLRQMGIVTQALESFAGALQTNFPSVATELGRARAAALEFGIDPSGEGLPFDVVDLGDLVRRVRAAPPDVLNAAGAVDVALARAVIDVARGPTQTEASGLSIYFPNDIDSYQSVLGDLYRRQPSAVAWNAMLTAYFDAAPGGQPGSLPSPSFASPDLQLQLSAEGVLAIGVLTPGTEDAVVDAQLLGGRAAADGSFEILLVEPATLGSGSATAIAAGWDFSFLQVTDGTVALDASVLLEPRAGGLRGRIPTLYQDATGAQAQVAIEFVLDASGVSGLTLVRYDSDGTAAQLTPEPGSLIAPLVFVGRTGGDIAPELLASTALDATAPDLGFVSARLPSGSGFVVALAALDASGTPVFATGAGTVP
jgi:hypothetical protein